MHTTCGTISINPLCQNIGVWAGDQYDTSGKTIARLGCGLTSLTMALNTYGASVNLSTGFTPRQLNNLAVAGGWYSGSLVQWDVFTRNLVAGWKFHFVAASSTLQDLADLICQGYPVIVGVQTPKGGHFVLVTGVDPTDSSTLLITDPAYGSACGGGKTTLRDYGNVFSPRGYVADPPPTTSAAWT